MMRRALPIALLLLASVPIAPAGAQSAGTLAAPPRPAATTGGATPAPLSPADQGWIARIQDTLNGITTLKGRFEQVAPDGKTSGGTVWLDRPGRMRFQYDPPSPLLLVAGNGTLLFVDTALKQVTTIPLERTPLGLLLAPRVSLSGPVTVTAFRHAGDDIEATLVRTAAPSEGSLTVTLSDQPLALRGWRVVDAQGRETRIALSGLQAGVAMAPSLFDTAAAAKQGE